MLITCQSLNDRCGLHRPAFSLSCTDCDTLKISGFYSQMSIFVNIKCSLSTGMFSSCIIWNVLLPDSIWHFIVSKPFPPTCEPSLPTVSCSWFCLSTLEQWCWNLCRAKLSCHSSGTCGQVRGLRRTYLFPLCQPALWTK